MTEAEREVARIDRVSATCDRVGDCRKCKRTMVQQKTFSGATLEECQAQADAWVKTSVQHRRCPK